MSKFFRQDDRIGRSNRISGAENVNCGPHKNPLGAEEHAPSVPFKIQHSKFKTRQASSLSTSLLVLVVLSTIVVAFLQSMSIERSVARSVMNRERAVLAAQAAVNVGRMVLFEGVRNSDSYITVVNGDYLFLGKPSATTAITNTNSVIPYLPLFSRTGVAEDNFNLLPSSVSLLPSASVATPTHALRPFLDNARQVNITWITNYSVENEPVSRIAFWIEDMQGRVNASFVGNTLDAGSHGRSTGTNVSELALFSALTNAATDTPGSPATQIVSARNNLLTPLTISQLAGPASAQQLDSVTAIPYRDDFLETIPFGFGYQEPGAPKFNLNYFVAQSDVAGLATAITNNLPNFDARKGGLGGGQNYANTLAASMIDYADADSTPSVGADYRGVDSTPFLTVIYTRYDWYQKNVLIDGIYNIRMRLATYAQLWNVTSKTNAGTFELRENNKDNIVQLGWSRGELTNSVNVTIPPNQIQVLKFEEDLVIPTGPLPLAENKINLISLNTSSSRFDYKFETFWNGAAVDKNLGFGADRPAKVLDLATVINSPDWTGHLPGLRYEPYTTASASQPLGDPRATFYLTRNIGANNYPDRNAWGGMATMRPNPGRYLTQPGNWPDRVNTTNTARSQPPADSAASISVTINTVAQLTNNSVPPSTNDAPQRISNAGSYRSATEIGNIFDPSQWHYPNYPGTGVPINATTNSAYGGGYSLRVGRPEHPKFANNGQFATQLLDILGVDSNDTLTRVSPQTDTFRLNINTASTNALRAIGAGIRLTEDLSAGAVSLPPSFSDDLAAAIADWRQNRGPFLSTAQLAQVTNAKGLLFGNTNQWTNSPPPATLHDAALEETFAKIYSHVTTRSSVFRIVGIGQALDPRTGKMLSSAQTETIVQVQKQRDANGTVTSTAIQTLYEFTK